MNDPLLSLWLFLSFGAVIAALSVYSFLQSERAEKRRQSEFRASAEARGLVYDPLPTKGLYNHCRAFPFFMRGGGGRMSDVMRLDSDAGWIEVFDYSYETGWGRTTTVHQFRVFTMKFNPINLPRFTLWV